MEVRIWHKYCNKRPEIFQGPIPVSCIPSCFLSMSFPESCNQSQFPGHIHLYYLHRCLWNKKVNLKTKYRKEVWEPLKQGRPGIRRLFIVVETMTFHCIPPFFYVLSCKHLKKCAKIEIITFNYIYFNFSVPFPFIEKYRSIYKTPFLVFFVLVLITCS